MDNFLGTLIFLLPGLMLYFWIQAFGVNPVVKHSTAEFTALAVLMWLPVSLTAIYIYNLMASNSVIKMTKNTIDTVDELKQSSTSFNFMFMFIFLSLIISFVYAVVWAKWLYSLYLWIINMIRKWRGFAKLSKTTSVWDEIFLHSDAQVVEIGNIAKPEQIVIGEIRKASRTFEPERNLYLKQTKFFTKLVENHGLKADNYFIDTKTGNYVKIFDKADIRQAQLDDFKE
ncbi:hypothetical protein NIE88_04990 [Sporolactobacillus shoreicorticis]|uniref:Uncharacterized protein n=1 Tax=Sporolactobacillus shoreicorticis TaxID=1923877 RepID=A0ABW5RYC0_9BACL|nr:hypothetical protein [Sporolactobacillus shoreicorticis]MCO7125130.1 hypothetical protein [Sporolactobacillus shoreicorticis]